MTNSVYQHWQPLIPASPIDLIDARLQSHHAFQVLACVAHHLMKPDSNDTHTSFEWDRPFEGLVSRPFGLHNELRLGFRLRQFALYILTANHKIIDELILNEISIGEALSWVEIRLEDRGIDTGPYSLDRPYEIPQHPVEDGQPFNSVNTQVFQLLESYFANAALLLEEVREATVGASKVRCWPHHFDIATQIVLEKSLKGEEGRFIGVGFSPGDESYSLPYFYVTPWPYPEREKSALPNLESGGMWHTEGWVGAVLPANQITRSGIEPQISQIRTFLQSSLELQRSLLR
ncbi:MAG TPA: hypothetical protein PKV71_04675 [Calditrichia bacterium]|nr:hypothetical protein [Calditrichota bacterium]HQV31145.1 hypothetical protein [Calditrichia bacterium]